MLLPNCLKSNFATQIHSKSKKIAPDLEISKRHLLVKPIYLGCQTLLEWPPPKQTKVATSPTTSAVSHPGFLKFLTRFHKKSTHINLLRTLMYKTQKYLQQQSHHARPQIPNDPRVSHSSLRKSKKNFTKPMPPLDPSTSDLQNPGKSTPKVQPCAATRPQAKL